MRVPESEGALKPETIFTPGEPTLCQADGKVLVVIPAYNEQDSIGQVVREVSTYLSSAEILVVDDGSTDATRERALESAAMVLTLPYNLGVGGAMRAGFRFALRHGFERVIQIDGDGQHDPRDAEALISGLQDADIIIGSRFSGHGNYDVRGPRRWAMSLLSMTLSRIAGTMLTDTTSGYRAAGPRAIRLFAETYPEEYLGDTVESIVISARAGMVVRQIPVRMRRRATGQPSQTMLRSTLYLIRALLAICFAGLRRDPQRSHQGTVAPRPKSDVIGSRL